MTNSNFKELDTNEIEKINHLIHLKEQLDFIWKFHPQNPFKQSIEKYHTDLINELNKVNSEIE
jgi:hypothetical protein